MNASNKIFFSFFVFLMVSCKAQQYPLNTDYDALPNFSYIKDLNNELQPFTGTYLANFQGNEIKLYITKQENDLEKRLDKQFYRDILVVKFTIKNISGGILQDTQNMQPTNQYNRIKSISTRQSQNMVILSYNGTNCRVGSGLIYLKKINTAQLSWDYQPNSTLIGEDCPPNADINVYLPVRDNLIFTKQ